jgi:hypothetical protein
MGAQLVAQALAYWADLPDRQFRILVRMALTALDSPDDGKAAATYFGGHELLARALGCPYPDGDSDEARKARATVLRHVRGEVAALRKAGACTVVDTGRAVRHGHSQTYLLTLGPPDRAGPHETSSAGPHRTSSAGPKHAIEQVLTGPPRNQEEPSQERSQEPSSAHARAGEDGAAVSSPGTGRKPMDDSGQDNQDQDPGTIGKGECPQCGQQAEVMRSASGPVIRSHSRDRPGETYCPGTGQPPVSAP